MKRVGEVLQVTSLKQSDLMTKCPKCGHDKQITIELSGLSKIVPIPCKCEKGKMQLQEQEEKLKDQQRKLSRFKQYSIMDYDFPKRKFSNWSHGKETERYYKLGMAYVERWDKVKAENYGLLLHGDPGVGKSYLASCIANELITIGIPVIVISAIGFLEMIKSTYNSYGDEGELELIKSLQEAELLIIDDLGAESDTEWAKEKINMVVDIRERVGMPLIITTNLEPPKLRARLMQKDGVPRIYDRIIGMCTPYKVNGDSKRRAIAQKKFKEFSNMLGGVE